MSILLTIETDLGKVAHAFAVGAQKLKAAIIWAANAEPKIAQEVAIVEGVANKIIDVTYPGGAVVATMIEAVINEVLADAAKATPAILSLFTPATAAIVQVALPIVQAQAQTTPGS